MNDTPLLTQYRLIDDQLPSGAVLLAQLGHFYEAFDSSALILGERGFTLTKRNGNDMAGIPYHDLDRVVSELRSEGFKVGIIRVVETRGLVNVRQLTEFS